MRLPWPRRKQSDKEPNFKKLSTVIDKIFKDTDDERKEMTRFLKEYKGEWWNKGELKDYDSQVQVNLLFSTVMTIAPLLTDNRPIWGVRARRPFMQNYIEALGLALEYLWDKLDLDMNVFKWALDALIMKIGIVKCYFDPDADYAGEISVEVVDPRMFFCAPGYDDIWDSPFCGIRISKPLSWIRMTYPEKGKEVKPDEQEGNIEGEEEWALETKHATVYEIWLKDSEMEEFFVNENDEEVAKGTENAKGRKRQRYPYGRIMCFTKDVLLDDKPSAYRHGKPPYVALYDYLVPHELTGMGEANQIEQLNRSLNRNLQLMDAWTSNYCDPPWLVDSNAGLDMEKVKTELPKGGGIFEYNGTINQDPIKKVQAPQVSQAVPMNMSMTKKFVEEITGVTDITKGMTTKSQRQSATEISTLVESSYTRTRQRVRNLEWSVKRLLYLILENMQQFYTEPRNFSLTTDNTVNYYSISNSKAAVGEMIRPQAPQEETELSEEDQKLEEDYKQFIEMYGDTDEIYAAFDLDIQTNSTLPMDKQSLSNLLLRLLEIGAGNPVTGMPIWEAVLSQLRIPRYKEIIAKMQAMFQQSTQPPQGGPQAPPEGEPNPMEQLLRSQE